MAVDTVYNTCCAEGFICWFWL